MASDVSELRARAYALVDEMGKPGADEDVLTKAAAHLAIDTITIALDAMDRIAGSLYALAQDRST